jgi:hypothetical protein
MVTVTAANKSANQLGLTPIFVKERRFFRKDFGRKEVLFFSL